MSGKDSLVSVVIVNWNGLEDIKTCLEYTRKQTHKNIEIVVVDNGSTDGSKQYLGKLEDIVYVSLPKNTGFTGGHIEGLKRAKGDYILLLNNDAVMSFDYIENALKVVCGEDSVGAVGGRAYLWDVDNELFDTSNGFYSYQTINPFTAEGIFSRVDNVVDQSVNVVSGSCVMVNRKAIDSVGYLYGRFFAYYEESDLFARMKRAGYKIIYSPDLSIWHANGKTSKKISSSFPFYMMMRNKFLFAVRNFDSWALRKFLFFYIKTGIKSTLKCLFKASDERFIDRAYAKAFFYNLSFGWLAFISRASLARKLGKTSYTEQIIREQAGISFVVEVKNKNQVEACKSLVGQLDPIHELIMVVSIPELVKKAKRLTRICAPRFRVCIDRGLIDTKPINLGVVSSKNDWVVALSPADFANSEMIQVLQGTIYSSMKGEYDVLAVGEDELSANTKSLGQVNVGETIMFKKSSFIHFNGFVKDLSESANIRRFLIYSKLLGSLRFLNISPCTAADSIEINDSLIEEMRIKADNTPRNYGYIKSVISRLLERNYRFSQIYYFFKWIFSEKVSLHLKLARIKNLFIFALSLRRNKLAHELKHIRNEYVQTRSSALNFKYLKDQEAKELVHLIANPEDLTVCIITRDRYSPLSMLIKWLEKVGLKKIVIIDNDSAFPLLTDFLEGTKYQVLEMGKNAGHKVAWNEGIIKVLLPNSFYLLSDPDVIPEDSSIELVRYLLKLHQKYPDHLKIGLGLKIDDLPETYDLKSSVVEWESQFWQRPLEDDVYEAGLDTTFAIYKPFTYDYFIHPSIRTGGPYIAKHLPWYNNSDKLSEEDVFYKIRADQNINTWDRGKLPERYVKELEKHRH